MDQIRLVVRTFRDRLFTEIFPGRSEVPKTLVFAKTDLHAEDIVEVTARSSAAATTSAQKITSKTTGEKPEDLLTKFRNAYIPRIAVTVDMIATGTDVKALECLLFMRNIKSATYFEQMKGRGVPRHLLRRPRGVHARLPGEGPTSSSSMPWACASATRPIPSRSTGNRRWRWRGSCR